MVVRQKTIQFQTVSGQTHNFPRKAAIIDNLWITCDFARKSALSIFETLQFSALVIKHNNV